MGDSGGRAALGDFLTSERKQKIDQVIDSRRKLPILLEDIHNIGNISAVCRTAEALGFYKIHLIQNSSSIKRSRRTAQGADRWLCIDAWERPVEKLAEWRAQGGRLAVAALGGEERLENLDLSQPLMIAFGNERDGVSSKLSRQADYRFEIPMPGFTRSFNISVAAAVSLYTLRQRLDSCDVDWCKLSCAEKEELRLTYYQRSVWFAEQFLKGYDSRLPSWTSSKSFDSLL